ncbi:porin family protein [Hoylesella pleuritidis]|uniref:porin family protein n=1 Tax=Hoylesella pleuritidis TaxID=407975 RepID=UPI0028D8D1E2|nr:porin family protein [Hoylesella pleuritidis]
MRKFILFLGLICTFNAVAQVGQHRNDFSIGFNGGYVLSSVSFSPSVPQKMHGGVTGGLSLRYVCEKYFNTVCSIYAEVNYASLGWRDKIQDINNAPVINEITGEAEAYSRTINYIQVPIMAHLAWGKESRGVQFFINLGPQFGIYLNESTKMNFDFEKRNRTARSSSIVAQDTMAVEKKFDYGIAAGIGLEYTVPRVGHFLVEGRYYYGLGNIYGDSKRDYFGRSNFGNIILKMTYLFDITKTKK